MQSYNNVLHTHPPPHPFQWEVASILMFDAFLPCQAHELSLAQTHILASTAQRTIQAAKIPGSHAQVH